MSSTTNSNNSNNSDKDDDNDSSLASSNSNSNARGTTSGNGKIISSSQPDTTTSDESGASIPHQSDRKPPPWRHSKTSTRAESSFAVQLMDMLRSEAVAGGRSVEWLPNGTAFVIQNQTEFEEKVLPRYFDSPCIFQSFLRRLYR